MKNPLFLVLLCATLLCQVAFSSTPTRPARAPKLYELRVYYPTPGNFNAIVDRFRQYSTKILAKHNMKNIGYWTPTDTTQKVLYYVLEHPDRAARDANWKAFFADPEWKAVVAKTEANGKIVERVEEIFLKETDFSPKLKLRKKNPPRTFELRTYTAPPGRLNDIVARFRNHTTKLFEQHGMENVVYWLTDEKEGQQPKLVYLLTHPSEAEGKQHFKEFGADPAWQKVKTESERNGPIVEKIVSVYLRPTDYSPLR